VRLTVVIAEVAEAGLLGGGGVASDLGHPVP
jgi:hypothetical protein